MSNWLKVKWKKTGNDENDLVANFETYCLRVERMTNKRFWYCLYYKNDEVIADYSFGITATNLKEAKKICETAMWVHRLTN